jgi:hypothetical protein
MGSLADWFTWAFLAALAAVVLPGGTMWLWLSGARQGRPELPPGPGPERYERPAGPTGCPVLKLHHAAARRDPGTILNDEADEVWHQRPTAWRGR